MGKLPYQLIVNVTSFLGENHLIKALELSSSGPATGDFESTLADYSEEMPHLMTSKTESDILETSSTTTQLSHPSSSSCGQSSKCCR